MEIARPPKRSLATLSDYGSSQNTSAEGTESPALVTQSQSVATGRVDYREIPLRKRDTEETASQDAELEAYKEEIAQTLRGVLDKRKNREIKHSIEQTRENSALIFQSLDMQTAELTQKTPAESQLILQQYNSNQKLK